MPISSSLYKLNAKRSVKSMNHVSTCLLITGPMSTPASVPASTLSALARSTSLSSLEKDHTIKTNPSIAEFSIFINRFNLDMLYIHI